MTRPAKDSVEILSQRTNRHIIRILYTYDSLIGSEIGVKLQEYVRIRFKSTSSLTEALQKLSKNGFIEKKEARYVLSNKSKERWVVKFLNLLVSEKIDRGQIIK